MCNSKCRKINLVQHPARKSSFVLLQVHPSSRRQHKLSKNEPRIKQAPTKWTNPEKQWPKLAKRRRSPCPPCGCAWALAAASGQLAFGRQRAKLSQEAGALSPYSRSRMPGFVPSFLPPSHRIASLECLCFVPAHFQIISARVLFWLNYTPVP